MAGDTSVGKSSLLYRYLNKKNQDKPTIGVEHCSKTVEVHGEATKLLLRDTGGAERFDAITSQYFRDTHGIMLVYDITDLTTFENLERWLAKIKSYHVAVPPVVVLVGNKSDAQYRREVPKEKAEILGNQEKIKFFEVSALADTNVTQAFKALIYDIYTVRSTQRHIHPATIKLTSPPQAQYSKKCCN